MRKLILLTATLVALGLILIVAIIGIRITNLNTVLHEAIAKPHGIDWVSYQDLPILIRNAFQATHGDLNESCNGRNFWRPYYS